MRASLSWARALRVALPSIVLALSSRADAITFTPYNCSQCPTMTEIPWTYTITGSGTELPQDPNCSGTQQDPCPHYINWLDYNRYFAANPYVTKFGMRFDAFSTESGYDKFCYGEDGTTLTCLSGTPATGWRDFTVSQNFQRTIGKTVFDTDLSITKTGVSIGRGRVCCGGSAWSGSAYAYPYKRMTGALLATNDVVYFRVAAACGTKNDAAVLWGPSGVDFDLYAKCNATPTPTSYDYISASGDAGEMITMPSSACTCPGTWYFAVASYSGSGVFNFVTQGYYPSQWRSIRAGTDFTASSAQMDTFTTTLQQAARHLYGATEGTQIIQNIYLYNSATCNNCGGAVCDLCFLNGPGAGYAPICSPSGNYVRIYQDYFGDPEGVAHEWGHKYFCAGEESYLQNNQNVWQCGHSNAASPWGTQNNFCYLFAGSYQDHKQDKTPGATDTTLSPAWDQAWTAGVTPWKPEQTPDNYDYRNFDFNMQIGQVYRQ